MRKRIAGCLTLGYVRVIYSIGERAKQLVKVICTLTYWAKILQWLWQLHTQECSQRDVCV